MRRIVSALGGLAALVAAAGPATASCGLEACPYRATADTDAALGVRLGTATRLTGFSTPAARGQALETPARVAFTGLPDLALAAEVPLVVLLLEDETRSGLGNALVSAEYWLGGLALGLQVELPIGQDAVAAPHAELLPYLRAEGAHGRLSWGARLGWRQGLDGGDDGAGAAPARAPALTLKHGGGHGPAPAAQGDDALAAVFIEDHAEQELLYQAEVGWALLPPLTGALVADGQQVISDTTGDRTFLQAGARAVWTSGDLRVATTGLLPLASTERMDWRAELAVGVDL